MHCRLERRLKLLYVDTLAKSTLWDPAFFVPSCAIEKGCNVYFHYRSSLNNVAHLCPTPHFPEKKNIFSLLFNITVFHHGFSNSAKVLAKTAWTKHGWSDKFLVFWHFTSRLGSCKVSLPSLFHRGCYSRIISAKSTCDICDVAKEAKNVVAWVGPAFLPM